MTQPLLLPPNVAKVSKACGDSSRFSLSGVHISRTETGYRVQSSNGVIAARVDGPSDAAEYPDLSALKSAPSDKLSAAHLITLLQIAQEFDGFVTFELREKGPVVLRCKSGEGQEFTGLIVGAN